MKPPSIKKFDYLYLGSIVVGLIIFALTYQTALDGAQAEMAAAGQSGIEVGPGLIIGGLAFGIAINLALWFLVSGLRIEFVKWVLAIFAAWGVLSILTALAMGEAGVAQLLGLIPSVMSIAAIYFLFQPDAKAWFAERRRPD